MVTKLTNNGTSDNMTTKVFTFRSSDLPSLCILVPAMVAKLTVEHRMPTRPTATVRRKLVMYTPRYSRTTDAQVYIQHIVKVVSRMPVWVQSLPPDLTSSCRKCIVAISGKESAAMRSVEMVS